MVSVTKYIHILLLCTIPCAYATQSAGIARLVTVTVGAIYAYVLVKRHVFGIKHFLNQRRNAKQIQQWSASLAKARSVAQHYDNSDMHKAAMLELYTAAEDMMKAVININQIRLARQYIWWGYVYRGLQGYYDSLEGAASWVQRRRLPSSPRFTAFRNARNQFAHAYRPKVKRKTAVDACDLVEDLLKFITQ